MVQLSERRKRIRDMPKHGRRNYDDETVSIVLDMLEDGIPQKRIKEETGVGLSTIACIKKGTCYAHVP